MPQDVSGAVDPRAPFSGSFELPDLGVTRRWFDGRDLTPSLCDEIIEVIRASFNDQVNWFGLGDSPQAHFEWKFKDRPTGVTVGVWLDADGRVVGFDGNVRRVWYLRGRPYVLRSGYDLCRLPAWQGRGLQRAPALIDGRDWHPSEDFSFGYSTHPATRRVSLDRGDRPPANVTHDYGRYLRLRWRERFHNAVASVQGRRGPRASTASYTARMAGAHDGSRMARSREALRRAMLHLQSMIARRAPTPSGISIGTIDRFGAQHEGLIASAVAQFDFVGDRSIEYLNWRFCDRRGGPFTVRMASRDGVDVAYAVTRVLERRAYLCDILAVPGDQAAADALVADAVELSRAAGADFMTARLPQRHPYVRSLKRAGFFDLGHQAGELIAFRRTDPADLSFLEREDARIHHVLADSDVV